MYQLTFLHHFRGKFGNILHRLYVIDNIVQQKKWDDLAKKANDAIEKIDGHITNWGNLDAKLGTADTKERSNTLVNEIIRLRETLKSKVCSWFHTHHELSIVWCYITRVRCV